MPEGSSECASLLQRWMAGQTPLCAIFSRKRLDFQNPPWSWKREERRVSKLSKYPTERRYPDRLRLF